jgi:hypothetical protein
VEYNESDVQPDDDFDAYAKEFEGDVHGEDLPNSTRVQTQADYYERDVQPFDDAHAYVEELKDDPFDEHLLNLANSQTQVENNESDMQLGNDADAYIGEPENDNFNEDHPDFTHFLQTLAENYEGGVRPNNYADAYTEELEEHILVEEIYQQLRPATGVHEVANGASSSGLSDQKIDNLPRGVLSFNSESRNPHVCGRGTIIVLLGPLIGKDCHVCQETFVAEDALRRRGKISFRSLLRFSGSSSQSRRNGRRVKKELPAPGKLTTIDLPCSHCKLNPV